MNVFSMPKGGVAELHCVETVGNMISCGCRLRLNILFDIDADDDDVDDDGARPTRCELETKDFRKLL